MLGLILTLGLFVGRPTTPPAHFGIVLRPTATGWSAHCGSGCSWMDLSANCPAMCSATITNNGVQIGTLKPDTARFSFVVETTATGWTASGLNGTAWISLSWGCPLSYCRARVDGFGVRGIFPGTS
jgi:hypothetical protein